MIEWLAPGFIYSILKDTLGVLLRRQRRLSPAQILELRQKWKPMFEEEIMKNHTQELRTDIIIRDVKRMDDYPNIDGNKKGISPWFRVGLMGTYHKGILVGLKWGELTRHGENAWRFTDYKSESGDIKAILVGKIRFESIESVDWKGDEYYYFPHIYCYFDTRNKEPYEDLVFCEQRCNPGWPPFYVDVAPYDEVRRLSKKLGLELSF